MGKIKLFEIAFYGKVHVYFPKQYVKGVLTLETDRDITLSGKIYIKGTFNVTKIVWHCITAD